MADQHTARLEYYLVGGAVRDYVLHIPPHDNDYVVVGTTEQDMLARGFKRVGKDFPVFLHPTNGCEYALARTERKTAPGYNGFAMNAEPTVTLKEDLARRDLTINAMALRDDLFLIDPFNGVTDIANKILRHVSPAFAEDPVRILRVARFAAHYEFTVHPSTMQLMQQMVAAGEVNALTAERVWQEMEKALNTDHPSVFFNVLRECGALSVLFPELDRLWGVPQRVEFHPEVDTGVHVMLALDMAALLSYDPEVRFATLMHDLGKGLTPADILPAHHGHEEAGVVPVQALCSRYKIPTHYTELAVMAAREHGRVHIAHEMQAKSIVNMLERCDAIRKPGRFAQLLTVCEADSRGRTGLEARPYPNREMLRKCSTAVRALRIGELVAGETNTNIIKQRIRIARINAVRSALGSDQ